MPIFTFTENSFSKMDQTQFSNEGIFERQNLQEAIKKDVSIICEDCLVISEEFSEWSEGQRRVDLLAIDKQANLVVIELKRDDTGGHMELQALRYAAMVSTMTYKQALEVYEKFLVRNNLGSEAEANLLAFLGWDEPYEESFATDVRIILVSSDFSKELTTSVMWLNERNLDIRCVRIIPYKNRDEILVDVQQVIPLPEVENYQIKVRQKSEEIREARHSKRDYTKYIYKGEEFNKAQLALAIITDWVKENRPSNFSELDRVFPINRLFEDYEEALDIAQRDRRRHFIEEHEIIIFADNSKYAISSGWTKERTEKLLEICEKLNISVEEVDS